MQKKFLSSLGLILLLNMLVKPLYILGIDAEVQNKVGQEEYGIYFALLNLSLIFNILIDFGINNFNNRNISQNQQLAGKHFSKLLSVKALLALIYAGITMLLGLVLGYKDMSYWILGVLVFNQVLLSFILFARSNLAALQMFSRDSIISVLDRSLLVVLCGIPLFTQVTNGRFEIIWFVYLQTIAYGITLFVSLIMVGQRTGRLRWNLDRAFSLHIFKKSVPYALFILSGSMYTRIDGIMLENLLADGSVQAGHYAQGYRFYEAAGMFAFLFAVLLLPMYSRMLKLGEKIRPMLEISTRLLLGTGVFVAILFFFNGEWLLRWRYDSVTENSVFSFIALMVGFVGVCMFYIYGTLMTANENLRPLNYISFGGLLLNIILNFALIPRYAAFGAALTTMITQIFAGQMQMLFVIRQFNLGVNMRLVWQFVIFILTFIVANYMIIIWVESLAFRFFFSAAIGCALLLLSRTIQIRQIWILLRAEK